MNQRQYTAAVHDILHHLEAIFKNQSGSAPTGIYNLETLIIRTDTIVFKHASDWRNPQQTQFLSPLEELELIDELCLYLQEQKHEYVRYRVFETLFSTARENALTYRREILCRLVSLGIVTKSTAVLECAALWMKSCDKEHAIYLTTSIVTDYCTLQTNGAEEMKACREISPRFCCVFMIALTAKYKMHLDARTESWPGLPLIDVVQNWIMQDSSLCFITATQMDKLWRTVIKATQSLPDSLSLTPLDGLAQWCVKSPFAPSSLQKSSSRHSGSSRNDPADSTTYAELHSRLHYAFLKTLLASKPALKAIAKGSVLGNPELQLWSKSQVHSLIGDLMPMCCSDVTPQAGSPDETAVDRFAQISQIAMTMRILNCTKNQFQSLSDPLPKTKLLELVAYGIKRRPSIEDISPMETGY